MNENDDPSSSAFFDAKYAADTDPWAFDTDPYELARYDTIIAHVDPDRHRRVFEPGCSIGVLTERLGRLCDTVHATDLSIHAVQHAQHRCRHLPGVTITVGGLEPPVGEYDLIVLSEIGYYLEPDKLRTTIRDLSSRIPLGGRLIAAHWIGHSPDHRLHADDVHTSLTTTLKRWQHTIHELHRHPTKHGYRLDIWDHT